MTDKDSSSDKKLSDKKLRIILITAGSVLLAAAAFCTAYYFIESYSPGNVQTEQYGPGSVTVTETSLHSEESIPEQTDETSVQTEYVSPVDFASLQSINPDVYAWIEIPGTTISYPVVQRDSDDTYYLHRNPDGEYSASGSIFSESRYNGRDFTSPVTILYGHHTSADNMFGPLQEFFSNPDFLASDPVITIYMPDGKYEYAVFAATPYDDSHILYFNDMSDPSVFMSFFNGILETRDLGTYVNEDNAPQDASQRVLILSTCLEGNTRRRFLVMGTLLPAT